MKELSLNSVSCCFLVKSRMRSSLTFSSSFVSLAYDIAEEAVRAIFSQRFVRNLMFSIKVFSDFSSRATHVSISTMFFFSVSSKTSRFFSSSPFFTSYPTNNWFSSWMFLEIKILISHFFSSIFFSVDPISVMSSLIWF